jgi:rhodanese-related sulfurtransferase
LTKIIALRCERRDDSDGDADVRSIPMSYRNFIPITFLFFSLLLAILVPVATAGVPDSVTQLVAETKQVIETVNMEEFKNNLDSKSYDMIIDVREPAEYAAGHIPGAINIPRGVIEFKIWKHVGFPDNTNTGMKTYLYCKSGGRCALATRSLKDLGFTNVIAVDMKFKAWRDAGYPIAR